MAALYGTLWEGWAKVGDGPFMQFDDMGVPSRWGSWGLWSHLDDENPRATLLTELNAATPAWWEDRDGIHFQSGVTLFAGDEGETLVGSDRIDFLIGGAGDDVLWPGTDTNYVHGGGGFDRVAVEAARADYRISATPTGWKLERPGEIHHLTAIEEIVFRDGTAMTPAAVLALQSGGPDDPPARVPPAGASPVGTGGDDVLVFQTGRTEAWGGAGADLFRLDGRSLPPGSTVRVLDFVPGEGDHLLLRHFREGSFSDFADPANLLDVRYGGRHVDIDSLADLRELAAGGLAIGATAEGDAVIVVQTASGSSNRVVLVGVKTADLTLPTPPSQPTSAPAQTALVGGVDGDVLVFRDGFKTAWGGDGADTLRIDARGLQPGAALTLYDFRLAQGDRIELRHFAEGAFSDALDPANPLAVSYGGRHATIDSLADLRELVAGSTGLGRTASGDAVLAFEGRSGSISLVLTGVAYDLLV
jgi:Ca2+-binding RTX toxin-like protein